ncbi:hypothetical protein [Uliginosibacterium gangwonense]|uniref:hypothetical protein n=1 Tax=Uliginosibacterium gangwonense TaxID=392736 RepID=UPI00036086AA|nr:hypothetical protein [Uliginosibacterium gangwonense]
MQLRQVFRVLGAKKAKGEFEGRQYDKTVLYAEMEVSGTNGNEVGHNSTDLVFGKSDNFEKVKGFPFPCELQMTVSITTRGIEVVEVHGLHQPKAG